MRARAPLDSTICSILDYLPFEDEDADAQACCLTSGECVPELFYGSSIFSLFAARGLCHDSVLQSSGNHEDTLRDAEELDSNRP
jgi:hypothetical protein